MIGGASRIRLCEQCRDDRLCSTQPRVVAARDSQALGPVPACDRRAFDIVSQVGARRVLQQGRGGSSRWRCHRTFMLLHRGVLHHVATSLRNPSQATL